MKASSVSRIRRSTVSDDTPVLRLPYLLCEFRLWVGSTSWRSAPWSDKETAAGVLGESL